jgi:hypothetical protein
MIYIHIFIVYIYITIERRQNWSSKEDVILCHAYIAISKHHEINTSQIRNRLWKKVAIDYNKKIQRKARLIQQGEQRINIMHLQKKLPSFVASMNMWIAYKN